LWQPTEDSSFETIPFIWADQQNNSLPWEAQAFDTENNIKNTQNSNNSDYNFWQHYNTATSSVAN